MTQRAHTSHWTLTICAIHWAYITQKALIPGLAHIAQRTCATHWAHMTKKATRTDLLSKKTKSIQNTSSTYDSKEHAVYITDYHTKGTSNTLRSYCAERTAIVEGIWHQYGSTHWGIITQSFNRIWHKKKCTLHWTPHRQNHMPQKIHVIYVLSPQISYDTMEQARTFDTLVLFVPYNEPYLGHRVTSMWERNKRKGLFWSMLYFNSHHIITNLMFKQIFR